MTVGKSIIFTLASLLIPLARAAELPFVHESCYDSGDQQNPIHLPYPNDCTKFYKCSGSLAYAINCPRGLHWSVAKNRCEYPSVAGCDPSIVVKTPDNSAGDSIENPDCPLGENPINPTHLAYPGDCTRFYKCQSGVGYPIRCPTGLHWSTQLNRCEWPNVAQCIWSSVQTPAPATNPSPAPVTNPTPAPSSQVTCPAGVSNPTQLPYPGDCNSFYLCINGQPLHVACPNNLHWSEAYKSCVPQSIANCQWAGPVTPAPAPATPAPVIPAPADLSDLNSFCRSQSQRSGYYAYPGDCQKFVQCYNGRGYIHKCPGVLLFNSQLVTCSRNCV